MTEKQKIENRLIHADGMAVSTPTLNEGPALYSHELVYQDNIARNLARIKEERDHADTARQSVDGLMEEINQFLGQDPQTRPKRGRILAGLAATVATTMALAVSNGGPGQIYQNMKTFPDHVSYVYDRYVGNQDPGGFSYPTVSG